MDNIVWVIIASAVTIALGGILLYAGSGTLGDVTDSATDILNTDPNDTQVADEDGTTGDQGTQNGDDSSGTDCPENSNNPFAPPGC